MQERPLTAFILSLLGSLFVIMGTIIGYLFYATNVYYPYPGGLTLAFTWVALIIGVMMLLASMLLYLRPELHVAWGVIILVFSVGSFTSVFATTAGFGLGVLGMVLGIVGGALAIVWRPGVAMPGMAGGGVPYRVCLSCGRMAPLGFPHCPYCGAPAPVIGPTPAAPPPR